MSDLFQILYHCLQNKDFQKLNETLWTYESKCPDYNIARGGLIGKGRNGEVYLIQNTDSYLLKQLPYPVVVKKTNWSVINDAARQQKNVQQQKKSASIFGKRNFGETNAAAAIPYSVVTWKEASNNNNPPYLVVSSSYISEILISAVWNHFYDSGLSPHFLYTAHSWLEPDAIFLITEMCGTILPQGTPLNKALIRSIKRGLQDKYQEQLGAGEQQQQKDQHRNNNNNNNNKQAPNHDVDMDSFEKEDVVASPHQPKNNDNNNNNNNIKQHALTMIKQEFDQITQQCVPFVSSMLDLPMLLPLLRIDMQLFERVVFEEQILVLLLQITLMQEQYKMVHHDLKLDNVYLRLIQKNDRFRNEELASIQYFCYRLIDARDSSECRFYLPNRGYLLKLGDAGMCTIHGFPQVISATTTNNNNNNNNINKNNSNGEGYQILPQRFMEDHKGEVREKFGIIPNFQRGYDVAFLLPQIQMFCEKYKIKPWIVQQLEKQVPVAINKQLRPDHTKPLLMRPDEIIQQLSWNGCLTRIPPPTAKILEMSIVHHSISNNEQTSERNGEWNLMNDNVTVVALTGELACKFFFRDLPAGWKLSEDPFIEAYLFGGKPKFLPKHLSNDQTNNRIKVD